MNLAPYRKAFIAAAIAALTYLAAALGDGLLLLEWLGSGIAALLAWLGVYSVPNDPTPSNEPMPPMRR